MKVVKEQIILEKFTEDSDPIRDLNIGTITWETLKKGDIIECIKFIQFPSNISDYDFYIHSRVTYYNKPRPYSLWNMFEVGERYVLLESPEILKNGNIKIWAKNIRHGHGGDVAVGSLHLLKSRFKIIQSWEEKINEKFTEDSDPIKDLNIGSKFVRIKNGDVIKFKKTNVPEREKFNSIFKCSFVGATYNYSALHGVIKNAELNGNILYLKIAFFDSDVAESVRIINKMDFNWTHATAPLHIWEKYFKVITKEEVLKESLNEKFVEDGDPIEQMGIGMKQQIKKFIEENDTVDYVKSRMETPATYISSVPDNLLDKETKKVWIEFLLRDGHEDVTMWDESPIEEMERIGVQYIPNAKHLGDENFWYKKIDDKYFLYTDDWHYFTPYFKENREIDQKSIETILKGEGYDLFEPYYDTKLKDILSYLSSEDETKIFNVLQPICYKREEESEQAKNLKQLAQIINDHSSLRNIEIAIRRASSVTLASSSEQEAYKDLIKAITGHYNISEYEYKSDKLKMQISLSGLNDFFASYWLNDKHINYYPPQYGWAGDFDVDIFLEELEEQLNY